MATLQEIIDRSLKTNNNSSLFSPYAPGAQVSTQGGFQSGYVAPMGTTPTRPATPTIATPTTPGVPTPTPTTPKEPTVGAALGFNAPELDTYGDPDILAYYKEQSRAPKTEKQLYRERLKQFQAEIDATNRVYDQMVREEQIAGEGRLGSQGALAARSGILGSDFAQAQTESVGKYNRELVGGINAERAAKIGAILGTVRKSVADELAAKNLARKAGVDSLLEYYKNQSETKSKNVKKVAASLIAQGVDPSALSEEELSAIVSGLGTTKENVFDAYATAKAEAEANKKDTTFTLSEGQARYDAEGNIIASRAKTYAPGDGTGVTLTTDNKRTLLGGGWSESDIATIENDVRANGLSAVIENARNTGATESQIKALEKAYGAPDGTSGTSLTRANLAKFYGLTDDESQSSFLGIEYGETNKEKLDTLESFVERYRAVGYSDDEILKLMQSGQ